MIEHKVRVMVMLDGENALFVEISAKRHPSGWLETTLGKGELKDVPRDLLASGLSMALSEVYESPARYPHASNENMGSPGDPGQASGGTVGA